MKAMVLAAGLGTRLRPLTDDRPKALVEVGGKTLLEITLARLRRAGVREVIVNVHHFADKVADFLKQHDFGMRVEISREDGELLDTGGGLKKAGWFFMETPDQPFLLHNVDVISDIDLPRMAAEHSRSGALATLAVQPRKTSRTLLFDGDGLLCGRRTGDGAPEIVGAPSQTERCGPAVPAGRTGDTPVPHVDLAGLEPLAFAGIHVISPRIFSLMSETGVFPIVPCYLRLAGAGEKIAAFRADPYRWRDLGRPEDLKKAADDLRNETPD